MHEIVEYEYNQFLEDISTGLLTFGRYIEKDTYEDEYSHNDIDNAQKLFIEKVTEYICKNFPGKYIVSSGWCVLVMTPEEARKRHVSERTIALCIVE